MRIFRHPASALLVFGALALPLAAQNERPAAEAAAAQDKPAAERPAAERSAAERSGAAQAPAQDANKARPAAADPAARDEALRKLALTEAAHRDRTARLKRLYELAEAKKDDARIAKIRDLLKKEDLVHKAQRERGRVALGDPAFRAVDAKLATGRDRAADVARKRDNKAKRQDGKQGQRTDKGQAPAGENKKREGGDKKADKPAAAPQGGERAGGDAAPKTDPPKAERAQAEQPKAQRQQAPAEQPKARANAQRQQPPTAAERKGGQARAKAPARDAQPAGRAKAPAKAAPRAAGGAHGGSPR